MQREFLKDFQVNGAPLPDDVIDAIMAEHGRDLYAAKADTGANVGIGGRTFTQDEVNRIVSDRLAREREKLPKDDEREKALKAREARLDCRDYLDSKKYPAAILDVLDCSDVEKFKTAADAMVGKFPTIVGIDGMGGKYPQFSSPDVGTMPRGDMDLADAFKPPAI